MLVSQHGRLPNGLSKELIAEYDRETAKTRKMLEAIPADVDFTWKTPHQIDEPGQVSRHLAETCESGRRRPLPLISWSSRRTTSSRPTSPHRPQPSWSASTRRLQKPRRRLRILLRPCGTRTGNSLPAAKPGSTIPSTASSATGRTT